MASVKINRGAPDPTDALDWVPKDSWYHLLLVRRNFVRVNIPHDCRHLVQFVRDAEAMYEALGYKSADDLIRNGLEIDPELARWAIEGLRALSPEEAVTLDVAVSRGKQLVEAARENPLGSHGGLRGQGDGITLTERGTSADYLTRRVARDAPELLGAIESGELSPAAAARQAGIIKPSRRFNMPEFADEAAARIRERFGDDWAIELKEAL